MLFLFSMNLSTVLHGNSVIKWNASKGIQHCQMVYGLSVYQTCFSQSINPSINQSVCRQNIVSHSMYCLSVDQRLVSRFDFLHRISSVKIMHADLRRVWLKVLYTSLGITFPGISFADTDYIVGNKHNFIRQKSSYHWSPCGLGFIESSYTVDILGSS